MRKKKHLWITLEIANGFFRHIPDTGSLKKNKKHKSLDWFINRFFSFQFLKQQERCSPSASLTIFAAVLARLMWWKSLEWRLSSASLNLHSSQAASAWHTSIPAHFYGQKCAGSQLLSGGHVLVCWPVATLDFSFDSPLTFDSKVKIAARRFRCFDFIQCFFTYRCAVWEVGSPQRCSSVAADLPLKIHPSRSSDVKLLLTLPFFPSKFHIFERFMV